MTLITRRMRQRAKRGFSLMGSIAVTLFGLLLLTFIIGRMMPLDPVLAIVGDEATQATYDRVYQQLGLDQPLHIQFFRFVGDVLRGDFGNAVLTGRPVIDDIARVFPATIELATLAILIGAGLGIPLGVLAAVRRNKYTDYMIRCFSLLVYSTPTFWFGMMGLLVFYAWLNMAGGTGRVDMFFADMVDPVTGFILIDSLLAREWDVFLSALRHIWLPATVLGLNSMAYICRMTRSFMLEQLSQEYIVTARIKGLSRRKVIWRHAFRNIRVQLVTIVALAYGGLLEGAVLIETVFSWPGFGGYLTANLMIGDLNAVMACTILVGVMFVTLNLICDLLYRVFDPRTQAA